jgi:hypothetical protein
MNAVGARRECDGKGIRNPDKNLQIRGGPVEADRTEPLLHELLGLPSGQFQPFCILVRCDR